MAAMFGTLGTVICILGVGIAAAIFLPSAGQSVMFIPATAWAGYGMFRLFRGLDDRKRSDRTIRAKSDLIFSSCVLVLIFVAFWWATRPVVICRLPAWS